MMTIDQIKNRVDPVIVEVRQAKREIFEEHGGDLESFFAGIRKRQAANPMLVKSVKKQVADGNDEEAIDKSRQ